MPRLSNWAGDAAASDWDEGEGVQKNQDSGGFGY